MNQPIPEGCPGRIHINWQKLERGILHIGVVASARGSGKRGAHNYARGPGPANLRRLLVGRDALPEHPVHITLGGDTSAPETPNATWDLYRASLSRPRADESLRQRLPTSFLLLFPVDGDGSAVLVQAILKPIQGQLSVGVHVK